MSSSQKLLKAAASELKRRRDGRTDLFKFSKSMFFARKGYEWDEASHHRVICNALMRVYRGECKRLIINIPPRYSKTELAVVNFVAWSLGNVPDSEFIHTSYSGTLAVNNSAMIRSLVRHEEYAKYFPSLHLSTEAKQHWETDAGGVFYAVGAGGTITGYGAGKHRQGFSGAIIIDDPHKADEARSEVMRKNVIDWFQNTLESRTNSPTTPIILIMQRLHEADLSGWLLAGGNGEQWEQVCIPAITPDGNALWPAKHTIEMLRAMEQASPYVFSGQYLQRPSPLDGGLFKPNAIQIIDAIPAGVVKWVRGWDLAASVSGDYTAGALLGEMADGRFIVADMVIARAAADERDALLLCTASKDGNKIKISLPQDPGAAGKTQIVYLTRKLVGYKVVSSPETGNKIDRAEPFASQVNVGNVLFLRGTWNETVKNEMQMFPNGLHDDQVDALSRAFSDLTLSKESVIPAVGGTRLF